MLCSRPKLAVWVVLFVGLRTGSRSKQERKHALRSTVFCKPAFLKKLAKSHRKEERVGGFPLAVVVENMSSEKVFQWRQQVGVIWSAWSSIIPDTSFPMITFCGGPYRVNPAAHGRDLLTIFRKRHRQLYFIGKRHFRIAQQRTQVTAAYGRSLRTAQNYISLDFGPCYIHRVIIFYYWLLWLH